MQSQVVTWANISFVKITLTRKQILKNLILRVDVILTTARTNRRFTWKLQPVGVYNEKDKLIFKEIVVEATQTAAL